MKMKFWIIAGTIVSLCLWATIIYIPANLNKYNYYYATHMKHKKDQFPFIPALGRSKLPKKYLPNTDVLSIEERDQSINEISQSNAIKHGDNINIYWDSVNYQPAKQDGGTKNTKVIIIDSQGNIDKGDKKEMTKQLSNYLSDIQTQIRYHSKKPMINLQRIYNWRFS